MSFSSCLRSVGLSLGVLLAAFVTSAGASPVVRLSVSPHSPRAGTVAAVSVRAALPRGEQLRAYRLSFGDGSVKRGRRLPARLHHVFTRGGHFRLRLVVTTKRGHRLARDLRVTVRPPVPFRPSRVYGWTTVDGRAAYNDRVLLIDSQTGAYDSAYHVLGTTTAIDYEFQPAADLPAGTTVDADTFSGHSEEDAMVTPPLPGHPDGVIVVIFKATTPAHDLTPADHATYAELYDAVAGVRMASIRLRLPDNWKLPQPISFDGGTIGVVTTFPSGPGFLDAPTGVMAHFDLNGAVTGSMEMPAGASFAGAEGPLVLVVRGRSTLNDAPCPTTFTYNIQMLAQVSQGPCGDIAPESSTGFLGAGAYFSYQPSMLLSSSNGAELAGAAVLGNPRDPAFVSGPRSSVVGEYDNDSRGPANFLSTANWQIVHTIDTAQSLRLKIRGLADDDAWVEAGEQRLVINAKTGATLDHDWRVSPLYGGSGWTVAENRDAQPGQTSLYLYRGSGSLVRHLNELSLP